MPLGGLRAQQAVPLSPNRKKTFGNRYKARAGRPGFFIRGRGPGAKNRAPARARPVNLGAPPGTPLLRRPRLAPGQGNEVGIDAVTQGLGFDEVRQGLAVFLLVIMDHATLVVSPPIVGIQLDSLFE
jgi:hypothetical protein